MNYLEIIKNVLANGIPKQATRLDSNGRVIPVENGTIGTFCEIFRHDMSTGFPLTTLRSMPFRSVCVELEGFIKGITDKNWYKERKCKFWNEWANPVVVSEYIHNVAEAEYDAAILVDPEFKKEVQLKINDLGPVYGYQWRRFGQEHYHKNEREWRQYSPGVLYGFDQLASIVEKLKNNPYDRRMVCSAWNPNQQDMMALMPCHYSWSVVVYGDKLNLSWNQRSVDLMLGAPSNIASYALLQLLLCKESGLKPGELVGKFEDCHIYDNLLDNAKEIVQRSEKTLPQLKIKDKENQEFSIFNWDYTDVELIGYDPHPKIEMGKVTV